MYHLLASLFLLLSLACGCQPNGTSPTTPSRATPPERGKTDVHIQTPGVDVNVKGKHNGGDVDVDVKRKDR